jgi:hypothetical protein
MNVRDYAKRKSANRTRGCWLIEPMDPWDVEVESGFNARRVGLCSGRKSAASNQRFAGPSSYPVAPIVLSIHEKQTVRRNELVTRSSDFGVAPGGLLRLIPLCIFVQIRQRLEREISGLLETDSLPGLARCAENYRPGGPVLLPSPGIDRLSQLFRVNESYRILQSATIANAFPNPQRLMITTLQKIACALFVVCVAYGLPSVHAASVIHWIDGGNQHGDAVLTSTGTFTTTFRAGNDVTATLLSGSIGSLFIDNYGGPTPGNNPGYLTSFVGSTAIGTGDGTAGHLELLEMSRFSAGSLQFDFAQPLTSADRLLFVDADSAEQYHLETYALVSSTYIPLNLLGWRYETFSGQTGVTPDSRWPTWNPVGGLLTATSSALNEELSVLTPDQLVSRLVITKTAGAGASTGFQVIEVATLAGDYNGNGIVDAADYTVWRDHLGQSVTLPNDTTPGSVIQADYDVWKANFGNHSGSGSGASAAVPEPATRWMFLVGILALCCRGRVAVS